MTITGIVYAFDLGVRCGVAFGRGGKAPTATALQLKPAGAPRGQAFGTLQRFLVDAFEELVPALCAKEAMLPTAAHLKLSGGSDDNIRMQAGLHAIVEAVCWDYKVPCVEASDSTVRKHFIGFGKKGARAETKAAVLARCHALGMLPRSCRDDNMADAISVWDWATATHCGRLANPEELVMWSDGR